MFQHLFFLLNNFLCTCLEGQIKRNHFEFLELQCSEYSANKVYVINEHFKSVELNKI